MKSSPHFSIFPFLLVPLVFSFTLPTSANPHEDFLHCLSSFHPNDTSSISNVVYTQSNASYTSVLDFYIRNLRFSTPATPKPLVIITPLLHYHIQATIYCAKNHGLQIRTRSGGHDYEGLSYVSQVPFVILDMFNFRSIKVDVQNKVAWAQTGAILGELYYKIDEKSATLTFPAGTGHTVALGGFISGGGYGVLLRKYGLAADNVIDAQFMDVNGRILDRKSMGEDLFWAIRGGGGSFGVVLAWKIKLVPVPETVTTCATRKTLEQNATKLVHRWQYVAHNLPNDVYSDIFLMKVNSSLLASFTTFFLGKVDDLIPLMGEQFPELGVRKEDCIEMSWIQAVLYFDRLDPNVSVDILLDRSFRTTHFSPYFKSKSDYVKEPIPESAFPYIWSKIEENEAEMGGIGFFAYGGKMDEIAENATPFPHRAGNLFYIAYAVGWEEEDNNNSEKYLSWIRDLYSYMTPFVSKSPREAYVGYRDVDLGVNPETGNTSYWQASVWGRKYFKNNFDRLVRVKTMIDPDNFFRHEQSIPPLFKESNNIIRKKFYI